MAECPEFKLFGRIIIPTQSIGAGGKQKKKLPRRPKDLPHHSLVLCSNLPNDHGHFNEV